MSTVHRPDDLLHEFLLAASPPDHTAVVEFRVDGSIDTLSYGALRGRADEYASALAANRVGIGDRVLLDADTSADTIAVILACSQLGAAFVPVSPEAPDQRVRSITESVEPVLCLRAQGLRRPEPPAGVGLARFGSGRLQIERRPARKVRHRRTPATTDTAYVVFTSGSTGRPKGVVMSHRAVVAFYRGMLGHAIVDGTARVATTSPLQFDFSLLDIGLAMGSGAAVVPVPRALLRWPRRFLRVLRATGATQVNGVPSIWRQVLRYEPERLAQLDELRGVLFCGENFPLSELRELQRLLPGARLVNCYGSTESMACSFADVPRPLAADVTALSIGQGHSGAELLLVDNCGRVVEEPDVPAEIYLRSPALFTGYWADPEATDAALVPDPVEPRSGQLVLRTGDLASRDATGDLHFCGRVDTQVQIRGNRVELAELEHRLCQLPDVLSAAATVLQLAEGEAELAAFVVPRPGTTRREPADLVSFCAQALPAYMVPAVLLTVDELPINANGKVDRQALAARVGAAAAR